MKKRPVNWTISDEMNYLDHLGSWTERRTRPRRKLLRLYIKTLHLRNPKPIWYDLALAYAQRLLKAEYGH